MTPTITIRFTDDLIPSATNSKLHTEGQVAQIAGADHISFDDTEARRRFAHLGEAYLSCRNFQFGAHHFRE
jgi:hypothetical protein